jgi:hypothetical protein
MTKRQCAARNQLLYRPRQPQEAQHLGYKRPALANPLRDLFVCQTKIVGERTECSRFFERIEVCPLDVLDQRQLELLLRCGFFDDYRNSCQPGTAHGTPAALAGDQLVIAAHQLGYDQGLEQSVLANGCCKLFERMLIEMCAWLMWVWDNRIDRDIAKPG